MKKIFATVAALAMFIGANAQIVSSHSRSIETSNYSRLYVNYSTLHFGGDAAKGMEDFKTLPGVQVGFLHGNSVSRSIPLYLEWGFNFQYNAKSKTQTDSQKLYGESMSSEVKSKVSAMRVSVPISLAYKLDIAGVEGLSVTPYVGAHVNFNITGKEKDEMKMTYGGHTENDSREIDFYDKDKMGSDYVYKRVQFGAQIGAGLNYKALYVGLGYSFEFNEISKKLKTSSFNVGLGVNF